MLTRRKPMTADPSRCFSSKIKRRRKKSTEKPSFTYTHINGNDKKLSDQALAIEKERKISHHL